MRVTIRTEAMVNYHEGHNITMKDHKIKNLQITSGTINICWTHPRKWLTHQFKETNSFKKWTSTTDKNPYTDTGTYNKERKSNQDFRK